MTPLTDSFYGEPKKEAVVPTSNTDPNAKTVIELSEAELAERRARFYPNTTATKKPETNASDEPIADEDRRDSLFGSVETLMSSYEPVLSDSMNSLVDHAGLTQEQRSEVLRQNVIVFDDAGISPETASKLHTILVEHTINPADDATVDRWATESRHTLRNRYGEKEADRRMELARQFIANRPALAELLTTTGLGSHPDIVAALVEHPNTIRLKPRAEKKKA